MRPPAARPPATRPPSGGRPAQALHRIIAGYLPATLIPALVSIGVVVVFTRLLSPGAYGRYSIAFTALMVLQVSLFYAIGLSIVRFYPEAVQRGTEPNLIRTAYAGVFTTAAIAASLAAIGLLVLPLPAKLLPVLWLTVPLLLLRACLAAGQAVRRASERARPYSIVESGQAIIGFAAGLILVLVRGPSAENVVLGLLIGAAAMLPIGAGTFRRTAGTGRLDQTLLRRAGRFSAPLALTYIVAAVLQYGDRFLVAGLDSAHALGIYTVATVLVERPTALAGVAITTATFTRVVKIFESEGTEAAQRQFGFNGTLLLAVGAPSCVGLMLIAQPLAHVAVGAAFRTGLARLLPIVAATALVRMMSAHFIDHAYHLARRSDLMLLAYGPFALLNLGLDIILIPRAGVIGAAWAALACMSLQGAASLVIARRVFPIRLPAADAARIALGLIPMVLLSRLITTPDPWLHLALLIGGSAVSYAAMLLALDLGGLRRFLMVGWRRRIAQPERA